MNNLKLLFSLKCVSDTCVYDPIRNKLLLTLNLLLLEGLSSNMSSTVHFKSILTPVCACGRLNDTKPLNSKCVYKRCHKKCVKHA